MCNCRTTINAELAQQNARIAFGFTVSNDAMQLTPPFIALEKIDERKRTKLPHLLATYCPFCGTRFQKSKYRKRVKRNPDFAPAAEIRP